MRRYTVHPDPRQCQTWAERFRPLIAAALAETAGCDERTIRRALRAVWDDALLGERKRWPYKAYLAEIRRQRNPPRRKPAEVPEGQMALLEIER